MLVISCSVCYHPKLFESEFEELYLLTKDYIICTNCKQKTNVSEKLKSDIRFTHRINI